MGRAAVGFGVLIAASLSQSNTLKAQATTPDPAAVVKACIMTVHNSPHSPAYPDYANKSFDAYYNRQSGEVFNNARLNVNQEAIYIFDKCMSEHGVPLATK